VLRVRDGNNRFSLAAIYGATIARLGGVLSELLWRKMTIKVGSFTVCEPFAGPASPDSTLPVSPATFVLLAGDPAKVAFQVT